jgi:hypothetical protein
VEIEGHPTQDLIDELERRGAIRIAGGTTGPDVDSLGALTERLGDSRGTWLFLSPQAYDTGFDEFPS